MNGAALETWPLKAPCQWSVVAWPKWNGPELHRIHSEFAGALATRHACLCLFHDSELDADIGVAAQRARETFFEHGVKSELRVAVIEGPFSENDWMNLATSVYTKIPRFFGARISSDHLRCGRVPSRAPKVADDVSLRIQ